VLLIGMLWVTAPFQCASDPDPERAIEDSAPEVLWELSEDFRARGDDGARRRTLEWIVERYPSSRYARRAEHALEQRADGAEPSASE
jgi:hypothetical protein